MSDLISRQAAIEIASGFCHPANIAKELAKLPSAQPNLQPTCNLASNDCISRQAILKAINNMVKECDSIYATSALRNLEAIVKDLPSAQPEPCEDAVSRDSVSKWLDRWEGYIDKDMINRMQYKVCDIPSVKPDIPTVDTPTVVPTCEDTISRQDAIRVASGYCHPANIAKELAKLPSAQADLSGDSEKLWKKAYERGKAEAQDEPHWIPCSERLPEPRKAVLGYAPRYQNIYALYYDSVYGWMIWNPLRDDCFPNSQGEIVAWMPLPEPYRGEGEK